MALFTASFDPAWAAVVLVVDGSAWLSTVDTITITRLVPGDPDIPVRGVQRLPVLGGYFVGSDSEAPLESSVTYRVDGYLAAVFVQSASVTVDTTGAAWGLWLKVPGVPSLTVAADLAGVGTRSSPTQGGIYLIAGDGGAVSQSVANFSGVAPDTVQVTLEALSAPEVAGIDAVLAYRVLLVQAGAPEPIPSGYYYVAKVDVVLTSPLVSPAREFTLDLTRTGLPVGDGQGIPGWSCAAVVDTYATGTLLLAGEATCFDLLKGP